MTEKYDYDVIIIGAGIAGLVCGCYLAKAGVKTLIVEKNPSAGGYCSSFNRKGFRFDSCVHSLSSLRKNGKLYNVLKDLNLDSVLRFDRHNPSDIIITAGQEIKIYNDYKETLKVFKDYFPKEKDSLERFFNFIALSSNFSIIEKRSLTFDQLLESYFSDKKLRTILATLILGLVGYPTVEVSAVVGAFIYREFIFDGGYYPQGGMQVFVDSFVEKFKSLSGNIIFSKKVEKIDICDGKATGVFLDDQKHFKSKYVVAACDVMQAYRDMISRGESKVFNDIIENLIPSLSAFLVYIGVSAEFSSKIDLKATVWGIESDDILKINSNMEKYENLHYAITSPSEKDGGDNTKKKSICLSTNMLFQEKQYWSESVKEKLASELIRMSEKILPGLSENIVYKTIATPHTLYKWTNNYRGAAYGWASTVAQFCNPVISEKAAIGNLFFAGHWANQSSGVTSVLNCGRSVANLILTKIGA